jgi:hypothetical protein
LWVLARFGQSNRLNRILALDIGTVTAMKQTLNGTDDVQPILLCPECKLEMHLIGAEPEKPGRDKFIFQCQKCRRLENRAVNIL